ncbi:dienelactone hydrolase [Paraoerskovia sediminicola]|uniref:Dienelactone hydrolase n=1 Tax=Paraoerskovia sediminicola TaxID=1138587 RepID=A0ABN6XAM5_9CELL|nr:dienelactone hydrolase family protein [Paraoerskovia sediminicola]BDZ41847.1 dienelactone hydrolase [Paraoerskovia sediminicola]
MTHVVLFHHAQGLTAGVRAFAARLEAAGHRVSLPDLYEGKTFDSLEAGIENASRIGFSTIVERGREAAENIEDDVVYAGFSLGAMPAQMLAQSMPDAQGALLFHACITPSDLGSSWPVGVPVQVHGAEDDELFVEEGDLDAARELVETVDTAELFLYPGDGHLFTDSSLPEYDADATALVEERVLAFLASIP